MSLINKSISLNIFTNCGDISPNSFMIESCYKSFIYTFQKINNVFVYVDENPYNDRYIDYQNNLSKIFPKIIRTTSLVDGYIKALKNNFEYMFMLEHDWLFNNNIYHSLNDIIHYMKQNNFYYLKFNKRSNYATGMDKKLKYNNNNNILNHCYNCGFFNLPHVINSQYYNDNLIKYIDDKCSGSLGIEKNLTLTDINNEKRILYGGKNYEQTVIHIDGRRFRKYIGGMKNDDN